MVKKVKLVQQHKNKSIEQVYPETHAKVVFGLADFINNLLTTQSNRLANGTDLNGLKGSGTYVSNGAECAHTPYQCDKWFTIYVSKINGNTCTQMIIDSKGHMWTRGAGGPNRLFKDWKLCN